ncbi:hypothetical protein V8E36_004193 [Tilletia maclaganii]
MSATGSIPPLRTSPALATLALTTIANTLTSPARSLIVLEVSAEHFDLDGGTLGSAGGTGGTASASGGPGGGDTPGATSSSVAASSVVTAPETADGRRAVSVIMLGGGRMFVVDIDDRAWCEGMDGGGDAGRSDLGEGPGSTQLGDNGSCQGHVRERASSVSAPKPSESTGQLSITSAPPSRQKTNCAGLGSKLRPPGPRQRRRSCEGSAGIDDARSGRRRDDARP